MVASSSWILQTDGDIQKAFTPTGWRVRRHSTNSCPMGKRYRSRKNLEKIETRAAPSLTKIATERSVGTMNDKQRRTVADFIAGAKAFALEAFYKGA